MLALIAALIAACTSLIDAQTIPPPNSLNQQTPWPGGVIPFAVDPLIQQDATRFYAVDNAIFELQARTCLRFQRRAGQPDYIYFTDAGSALCWQFLTRTGGMQNVNVGTRCVPPLNPQSPTPPARMFSDCDLEQINVIYQCTGLITNNQACYANAPPLAANSTCGSACNYGGPLAMLYRSYNNQTFLNDHAYTTSTAELQSRSAQGFIYERPVGYLATTGTDLSCRCLLPMTALYNAAVTNHFYTTRQQDITNAQNIFGYTSQGVIGYCANGAGCGAFLPLYRFYSALNSDHFYTTDETERAQYATNILFVYEGIECYLWQYPIAAQSCFTSVG
uniref:Peptidase M12A domain-containing protein n=1 Tax=Plectus sambesii TaxID=2011161 RepID=A0A914UYM7_9BILA